ncbi:MAG: LAGLIDADG family homing endonuclease [Nanoarchaeota archaeon]
MKYTTFKKGKQKKFMQMVKKKSEMTWDRLAKKAGISRSMIFFYRNEHSKIPEKQYHIFKETSGETLIDCEFVDLKTQMQDIQHPKRVNKDLSELIGILAGDGHISAKNHEVSVSGHLHKDYQYMTETVIPLFQNLFSCRIHIKTHEKNNNIRCIINSIRLAQYLVNNFQLPQGRKKGKLHIPKSLRKNKDFLIAYIRGLFDTDGSVYFRRNQPVVSIISRDPVFLNEIKSALKMLKYSPSLSGKNIYLYRKEDVKRFFNHIQPHNKKHLQQYKPL